MNYQELINEITQANLKSIKSILEQYPKYDQTKKGKITEVINPNKYKVLISGNTYTVSSSIQCEVGDLVWACIPCGNLKDMFVVAKTK